jgi:CRISPR-associated Cas5-like protein
MDYPDTVPDRKKAVERETFGLVPRSTIITIVHLCCGHKSLYSRIVVHASFGVWGYQQQSMQVYVQVPPVIYIHLMIL